MRMRKRILMFVIVAMLCGSMFLTACGKEPAPHVPPETIYPPDDETEEVPGLEEQSFTTAMEAFNFGKDYFANAEHYETTVIGRSVPAMMSGPQVTYAKRYKSDTNNDFLQEVNNYTESGAFDKTFGLKLYKNTSGGVKYYRADKKYSSKNPNGVKREDSYVLKADFKGASYNELASMPDYTNISGTNPQVLSNYIIEEDTISDASDLTTDGDYAYTYSFVLNEDAVEQYKKQVGFYSGFAYGGFKSLTIQFNSDKYGRIVKLKTDEVYQVMGVDTVSTATEYFSYSLRPIIDMSSGDPVITYAENEETASYTIRFSSDEEIEPKEIMSGEEIGELPQPVKDGFDFGGWYTQENGQGELYHEKSLFAANEDITLYSHWVARIEPVYEKVTDAVNGDYYYVKSISTDVVNVVIPATYEGLPVRGIGKSGNVVIVAAPNGFSGCTNLRSVTIPDSVEYIGQFAFSGCESLIEVQIPSSVKKIDKQAFEKCVNLSLVVLNEGLTEFGGRVFAGCVSLIEINIPSTVTTIAAGSSTPFDGCTSLEQINVEQGNATYYSDNGILYKYGSVADKNILLRCPEGITEITVDVNTDIIGTYAFKNSKISSIILPAGVTNIETYAFTDCKNLTAIEFPEDLTQAGARAFLNCTSLMSVSINGKLNVLSTYIFSGCTSLEQITIPKNIVTITASAFQGCANLKSVTLREGLEKIENYAFYNCASLIYINIPSTVTSIGESSSSSFSGCTALQGIGVAVKNSVYYSYDGVLYKRNSATSKNILVKCPEGKSELTVSADTDTIGAYAFGNSIVSSIELPNRVSGIEANAFNSSKALTKITLSLFNDGTPPVITTLANKSAFTGTSANLVIYVPSGSLEIYKAATNWTNFAGNFAEYV